MTAIASSQVAGAPAVSPLPVLLPMIGFIVVSHPTVPGATSSAIGII